MEDKSVFSLRNIAIIVFLVLISFEGIRAETIKEQPKAINGVLDLSHWNFQEEGPVNLSGEWFFYWEEFLPAEVHADPITETPTGIISLPNYWNGYIVNGKALGGAGYASFFLKVKLPKNRLNLPNISNIVYSDHPLCQYLSI